MHAWYMELWVEIDNFFVRGAAENGEKFENFDFSLTEKQWNLLECETGQNKMKTMFPFVVEEACITFNSSQKAECYGNLVKQVAPS